MSVDAAPLEAARQHLGLSVEDLWVRCLALGSLLSPVRLASCLRGREDLEQAQYDIVAQALNEGFMDRGGDHPVPYAEDRDGP